MIEFSSFNIKGLRIWHRKSLGLAKYLMGNASQPFMIFFFKYNVDKMQKKYRHSKLTVSESVAATVQRQLCNFCFSVLLITK